VKSVDKNLEQKFADLKEDEVLEAVRQGLDNGTDPQEILKACQNAMNTVGEKFEKGEYFISDLMLSGQIFKQVNEMLKAKFGSGESSASAGTVVIGTVAGDIHDIGKDLVVGLLESNNFKVIDLGVDQPKEVFVEKVKETNAPVVALSGLLTIAFDAMREIITALEDAGLRDKVKVMIGGGTVSQTVCEYTGADGWGDNAQIAVKLCREWMGR
jgi:methanogenic corrinoid protein MtbC1